VEHSASVVPREVYLDNNATTQPLPEVREAMLEVLGERFGNPSSAHAAGDRSRECVHRAREAVATLLGADPYTLVFTSSGTEANNMVLGSVLHQPTSTPRVVTTEVEHSSILQCCEYLRSLGAEVVYLRESCRPTVHHGR